MKTLGSKRGFTLVELLVAATIAALLATVGVVSFVTANRNARNARRQADLEQVRAAIELYRTENGCYPGSSCGSASNWAGMMSAVSGFITTTATIQDPRNTGSYVYTYTPSPGAGSCAGRSYSMCANMEPDPPTAYCLCNP